MIIIVYFVIVGRVEVKKEGAGEREQELTRGGGG
jgi:hypothetical protein